MEPDSAEKDCEKQKREGEQFHTDLLCCGIPDVLAERKGGSTNVRGRT
jgi:hypothetical protein